MEPFEKDELTDRELDAMLPAWSAPEIPAGLKAKVFPAPWWRKLWGASIRLPLPVACALGVLLAVGAIRSVRHEVTPQPGQQSQVVVRTERVEVPVVRDRIVYRERPRAAIAWQRVSELRPRIIRGRNE